jgi:hypothetical protein
MLHAKAQNVTYWEGCDSTDRESTQLLRPAWVLNRIFAGRFVPISGILHAFKDS